MVDFRRWMTAFAVLALFVGLASAQVPGGVGGTGPLTCNATVAVPPQLRAEGMTELIGDIVITCSGGANAAVGSVIPTANITVSLQTNVTSRLLGTSGVTNASEALLLIDEPGGVVGPVAGFGSNAPQSLCPTPGVGAGAGGCVEYVSTSGGLPVAVSAAGAATYNVFQGLVSNNQVTFNGIPILAPVSSGNVRVYRITNVRANVSGIGGAGLAGVTALTASISISGSTSLPINNAFLTAGFIQSGLTTVIRNANQTSNLSSSGAGFNQCGPGNSSGNPMQAAILQYTENFGTAFKTRVAPTSTYTGQAGSAPAAQNIPGTIYNSESGFIFPAASGNGYIAGLADYGTRLKAVFNNIPAGVRIFVSTTNLATNYTSPNTGFVSNTSTASFAQLVNGEASPDTNGFVPALNPTTSVNSSTTGLYEIPQSGGSAVAVWEVMNTNPAAQETFQFGVWVQFTVSPATNSPAPGTATINMSFAPTPTVPFTAAAGAAASGSLTIPRFADTSTAKSIVVINICQTLLLFPFVTNQSGFDTGLSIANTSTDPIGTGAQSGTCTLTWYDGTGKTPATTVKVTDFTNATASSNSGTVWANLVSALAPGFQGYTFALCNFQYAHGFAFISDAGARNLAMGYLALVVNGNTSQGVNRNSGSPAGEGLGH